MDENFVILDLETTGLSKDLHKITEIAAIKVKNCEVVDVFQTLINPEVKIPRFITRLTGIDNKLVENAPTIDKVLPDLMNFLEDHTIVAHNASFDHGFICHNVKKHLKCDLKNEKVCTRKLANRLVPNLGNKKLSNLCEYFNFENDNAHRAMSDVKVTYKIFNEFLKMAGEKNIKTKNELIKFQDSKIIK